MIPSAFEDFREVSAAVVKVRNVRFVPLVRGMARDAVDQLEDLEAIAIASAVLR
jgi:hypothetical protein